MFSDGAPCCEAMADSGVSSGLSTARPLNRNVPVTCWINVLSALSSGFESSELSAYCYLAPYLGGCEDKVHLGALTVAHG